MHSSTLAPCIYTHTYTSFLPVSFLFRLFRSSHCPSIQSPNCSVGNDQVTADSPPADASLDYCLSAFLPCSHSISLSCASLPHINHPQSYYTDRDNRKEYSSVNLVLVLPRIMNTGLNGLGYMRTACLADVL